MFRTLLLIISLMASCTMSLNAQSIPQNITSFLADTSNDLSEDNLLPEKSQAVDFARSVATNWKLIAIIFPTLAPDARRQQLIVAAAEFLPPHDYVTFIGEICDLKTSGKATFDVIKTIATAGMFKNGFLAYNYDKPAVAAVITKLQGIMSASDPGKWTGFFSAITTGSAKQTVIAQATQDGNPLPESYDAGPSAQYNQLMGIQ